MLIGFTGAQCTGKTTLLKKCKGLKSLGDTFHQYKFVDEVTRKVKREGHNINLDGNNITQLFILNEHLKNHTRSDDCVLDRCILDGYIYTCCLARRGLVDQWVCEYACNMLTELIDNLDVIFYTEPDNIPLENDGVRSVDVKFRQEIIDRYEQLFRENYFWQDKVVRLHGTVEERIDTILKTIDESTNIRQQQNNKALRTNVGV
jgi:nicotinamide riboside kinase